MPGQSQNSGKNAIFEAIDLAGEITAARLSSEPAARRFIAAVNRLREILPDAEFAIAQRRGELPGELAEWVKRGWAALQLLETTMPVFPTQVDEGDFSEGMGRPPVPEWARNAQRVAQSLAAPAALLKWRRAPTPKRRRRRERKLTARQIEILQSVGEWGNCAEAARRIGIDPKTVREIYAAGLKNAGKLANKLIGRPATVKLPTDRRGESQMADADEGPAAIRPAPGVRRDRRR
jgi:hypothetical protein